MLAGSSSCDVNSTSRLQLGSIDLYRIHHLWETECYIIHTWYCMYNYHIIITIRERISLCCINVHVKNIVIFKEKLHETKQQLYLSLVPLCLVYVSVNKPYFERQSKSRWWRSVFSFKKKKYLSYIMGFLFVKKLLMGFLFLLGFREVMRLFLLLRRQRKSPFCVFEKKHLSLWRIRAAMI